VLRNAIAGVLLLAGAMTLPACLAQEFRRPAGQGPFGAAPTPPPALAGGWIGAVALGVLLGVALAVVWWAWSDRRPHASPGRGDASRLDAALRLVEQVVSHGQHRMKVVPLDRWVAKRRRKQGRRVD